MPLRNHEGRVAWMSTIEPSMTAAGQADPRSRAASLRFAVPIVLLLLAAVGWWWSVRMAGDMSMGSPGAMDGMDGMSSPASAALSFGAFLLAWFAMMTAMMFPAISPVVKLYSRGAAAGRVAPLPFFVAGYIAVWTSLGVPAFFAWRALMDPLADGTTWAARLAGGVLIAAAVWQLTPLKSVCLRHCRSPMSVFMRYGAAAAKPLGAVRMGATHGGYCLGVGTMNIAWMLGLALLILLEKNAPWGERIALGGAVALGVLGALLIVRPETLSALI
jgi:predicted metal-binding membrane protein